MAQWANKTCKYDDDIKHLVKIVQKLKVRRQCYIFASDIPEIEIRCFKLSREDRNV